MSQILTEATVTTTGYLKYFMISEVNMKMNIPSPIVQTASQNILDFCDLALIRDGIPCMEVRSANPVIAFWGLFGSTIVNHSGHIGIIIVVFLLFQLAMNHMVFLYETLSCTPTLGI